MKAYLNQLEMFDECRRDIKDNRRKVSFAVFSYIAENGDEYRRSFTSLSRMPESYFWTIAPKEITVNPI
jgi:hypothetical protein